MNTENTENTEDTDSTGSADGTDNTDSTDGSDSTETADHVAVGVGVIGGPPIGESARAAEDSAPNRADPGGEKDTGDTDEVSTIVAEVRADAADAPLDELERVLRERLGQAGIEKTEDELARLAEQITTGED